MTDAALTRRSLARGAAWSVPVIAVAAAVPAFAASPCVTTFSYMLDWGNNAKTTYVAPIGTGATKVGTASALAPTGSAAAPVGVTFTSTYVTNNSTDRRASDNLTVPSTTNIGGLGANVQGLLVAHASTSSSRDGFRQQVVIHFDRSVSDLTFVITDVDSRDGGWYDQIELTGTRTGTYNTRTLTGSGTTADAVAEQFQQQLDRQHVERRQRGDRLLDPGHGHHAHLLVLGEREQPAHPPHRLRVHSCGLLIVAVRSDPAHARAGSPGAKSTKPGISPSSPAPARPARPRHAARAAAPRRRGRPRAGRRRPAGPRAS